LRDVVNDADVAVVGGGGCLRFTQESLLGAVVVTPLRGKKLERDRATELRVGRLVDDAHPTAANSGDDLVLGDGPANQRVGRGLVQTWKPRSLYDSQTLPSAASTVCSVRVDDVIGRLGYSL